MYEKYIKRALGFFLSLIGIIILSPILLIICLAIKIDSKGPIIFKQKRVGKNKKYFNIYK
ncbi:MAG: sugar transferase, partial [Tetragenococcus koreensis]|nr:sugar transferase [Tetragenococcus koreensis]